MQGETLKMKVFHMEKVSIGNQFKLDHNQLQIKTEFDCLCEDVKSLTIRLLEPDQLDLKTNTIMDILPISAKVLGVLGTGITHTLTGVSVIMTGTIDEGEQLHEFGSSDGVLRDHLFLNRPGTPNAEDYIILIDLLVKKGTPFDRELCLKLFRIVDNYLEEIREQLKLLDGKEATETHIYEEKRNPGKPKVTLVKQVAGQDAMYDMLLFPDEPSGFKGGHSIIDMNNMPIFLSANEYRDGAIRSMV